MANDKIFEVHGNNTDPILIKDRIIDPAINGYQDILKFSNAKGVVVDKCFISGGSEDCIDMNRGCRDIVVAHCELKPRGKYGMTIKDTSSVLISRVLFSAHGKEADIDLGNWSDTSTEKTKNIVIHDTVASDGKPVRIRCGNADWPDISGGNCKIDYVGSYLLKAYWWAKYLWRKVSK